MTLGNTTYTGDDLPEALASFFKRKVDDITEECSVDDNVYNGIRLLNVNDCN